MRLSSWQRNPKCSGFYRQTITLRVAKPGVHSKHWRSRLLSFSVAGLVAVMLAAMVTAQTQPDEAEEEKEEYGVELIVFEDLRDQALRDEYWAIDPGSPTADEAISLTPPSDDLVRLLSEEQLKLNPEWAALQHSKSYKPLLHFGWWQPDWPRSQARSIYLQMDLEQSRDPSTSAGSMPPIEGTIRVYQQHYLHVALDLIYRRQRKALLPVDILQPDPKHYRLKTTRRIRFDELHYIDHPLFGVLLYIAPPPERQ